MKVHKHTYAVAPQSFLSPFEPSLELLVLQKPSSGPFLSLTEDILLSTPEVQRTEPIQDCLIRVGVLSIDFLVIHVPDSQFPFIREIFNMMALSVRG